MPLSFDPAHGAVFLIDKPIDWTSHDVVGRMRRVLGLRRVGHAGTLDPMATGLLLVAAGPATRLLQFLSGLDKTYTGAITFGATSDTYDARGAITPVPHAVLPDGAAMEEALRHFLGPIQQRPPAHSAIKIGGRKAYELARKGEAVELKPRAMTIHHIRIVDYAPPQASFTCTVSSGTYVRSLAHDLGQRLGCGAYLSELRRTRIGQFDVASAVAPEAEALEAAPSACLEPAEALGHLPRVVVESAEALERLQHGGAIAVEPSTPEGLTLLALDVTGRLLAVGVSRRVEDSMRLFPSVVMMAGG